MYKATICLLVLVARAGGGYRAWQRHTIAPAPRAPAAAAPGEKAGPPTKALVATRDLQFAITAAGEIGADRRYATLFL
jgi:hypothetical protein